jgi:aspartate carbamoyltransferase regulatory subunit
MLRRESAVRRDVDINVFQPGGIVDHVQDQAAFDVSSTARLEEVTIHSHE